MLLLPTPWVIWVALLVLFNLILPWFFIAAVEAKVVLVAFMPAAFIQMAIFSRRGFVRLLGVGHFVWLPMIPWLWARLELAEPTTYFLYWMTVVIVLDSLSLLVDIVDVVRYLLGEREPTVTLPQ